ncbi:glycosyl hydrolase [Pareuzebyella sediminis]|uniref:glycosyl hydrolase n=1 Tax=Pareuzebyella sediminis TaxID=2607998 RepID=UPI0011EC6756|nr:glycosyl hydrolase [Pareuzebyella sediminis]
MSKITYLIITLFCVQLTFGQSLPPEDFKNPPNAAKPRVWWHWMNGNITKEGIKKDLDWMEKTGIGGFQNFDANLLTPVVVPNKLVFMTPEWKESFKFTTELAIEKGLEMAIAGSPGWSVTGGPWVQPKDGMKKYVWSESNVEGGKRYRGTLPSPAHTTGAFQNVAAEGDGLSQVSEKGLPEFYADVAVMAFKLPKKPVSILELRPKVKSSKGQFSIEQLTDTDLNTTTYLPPSRVGEDMWIQYEFDTPQTFRAYAITGAYHSQLEQFRGSPNNRALLVSNDGINFRKIADIPGTLVPQTTGTIPPTTAKFWRFTIETLPPAANGIAALFGAPPPADPDGINVAEYQLYADDRIHLFEQKAGFAAWQENGIPPKKINPEAIPLNEVIDLTDKLESDGTLEWEVPEGHWKIIRLGYSLTGRQNHPASPEATGLEVDKVDENAVRTYINTYLDMYEDATGGKMGKEGLGYLILDSYEAGHMNWTIDMPEEFLKRRHYDLKPWIPVLAGYIVKDNESSEKFLWDFRKTIGEMIVENHYDVIGDELHKRNMGRYTESHESGRIYLADGMDVKRHADIPMSAMWTPGSLAGGTDEEVRSKADIRESASVANIYGKPFVAAESMTSIGKAFQEHPERLKRTADMELASGLNRFVIHTSVHQPLETPPGFSLGPFGQYFTRHETWSGAGAQAWISYLARSSHLLQQGRNVADVLYYYGENTNITLICQQSLPDIPEGHEFDFVNATILKQDIEAKNGQLLAPSGNLYKVLMLDESAKEMTLGVLKKIKVLQDSGVPVVGAKPTKSPSLEDDMKEYNRLADEVGANMTTLHKLQLTPDVKVINTDHTILFKHRKINYENNGSAIDIYWLNNRHEDPTTAVIDFNISGKIPMLWNPETGKINKVGYEIKNGRTQIPITFKSWDALFIIFDQEAEQNFVSIKAPSRQSEEIISGPWTLNIDSNQMEIDSLTSWTEYDDIKYFSGTGAYVKTFTQKKKIKKDETYVLQFEDLKNIAEVFLNDSFVGTIWKKPYEIEVTEALKKGKNELKIKVTNTWVNRLVGDARADENQKNTFTTMPFYKSTSPLLSSGLLGKVKLVHFK